MSERKGHRKDTFYAPSDTFVIYNKDGEIVAEVPSEVEVRLVREGME